MFIVPAIAFTTSRWFPNAPDLYPNTVPGIRNTRKIKGTIEPISGAPMLVRFPFESLNGEPAGKQTRTRASSETSMLIKAQLSADDSFAVICSIFGISSGLPSMFNFFSRGSTTLSVMKPTKAQ